LGRSIVHSLSKEDVDQSIGLLSVEAFSDETLALVSMDSGHCQRFIDRDLIELWISLPPSVVVL
jgi:hypothetical protein